MKAKIVVFLVAGLLAMSPNFAIAKSSKSWAPRHHAKEVHGASFYAPGHVKKRLGLKSARTVAPGHLKRR